MKFRLSVSGIAGNIRQLAAFVGVVISTTNAVHLPGNIRGILLAGSGVLLTAEHLIDGIQGTTSAAPVATAPAPVKIAPEVLAAAQQIVAAAGAGSVVAGSSSPAGQA